MSVGEEEKEDEFSKYSEKWKQEEEENDRFTPSDIENVLGNVAFMTDKSPILYFKLI